MLSQLTQKSGSVGTLIAALGCPACFPILGTIGSALGLSFLHAFETTIVNHILPAFALLALILNSYQWGKHGQHIRGSFSVIGPIAVLMTLYQFPFWEYSWSIWMFYSALILIIATAIYDLLKPAVPACATKDTGTAT